MGDAAQCDLGCDEVLGQGFPPSGPLVVSQPHQGAKVHMLRVQNQAKQDAHSRPPPQHQLFPGVTI
jgi:hypothetical protein